MNPQVNTSAPPTVFSRTVEPVFLVKRMRLSREEDSLRLRQATSILGGQRGIHVSGDNEWSVGSSHLRGRTIGGGVYLLSVKKSVYPKCLECGGSLEKQVRLSKNS